MAASGRNMPVIRPIGRIDTRVREVRLRKGTPEYVQYRKECAMELRAWRQRHVEEGLCNSCNALASPGFKTCVAHRAYYREATRKVRHGSL